MAPMALPVTHRDKTGTNSTLAKRETREKVWKCITKKGRLSSWALMGTDSPPATGRGRKTSSFSLTGFRSVMSPRAAVKDS